MKSIKLKSVNKKIYLIFSVLTITAVLITSYFFVALMNRYWPFQDGGYIHSIKSKENLKKHSYWANKIKNGGYVLHIRHGQREKWDTVTAYDAHEIVNNINARESSFYKATCLTERGIEDSKLIGIVFEHAKIPIGKIISSPSCRSRETAEYAFKKIDKFDTSILHATAVDPDEWDIMAKRYKNLLIQNQIQGKNLIISGHGNTIDKYYKRILSNKNLPPAREIANILEAGFYVLKVEDGKIYYKHKFTSLREFAVHVYSLKDF